MARLNGLPREEAERDLLACCGSANWARRLAEKRPFGEIGELLETADRIWGELGPADWVEAFRQHPRIGEKTATPHASTQARRWSEQEQGGVAGARQDTLAALAEAQRAYEARFGYIFIVCATGKTSEEMLALLVQRLQNDPGVELRTAAEEQRKITRLRLKKLLSTDETMGGISTHVLDTVKGRPAGGVRVVLEVHSATHGWKVLAQAHTDSDGRAKNLLPSSARLEPGTYRLTFDAAAYFRAQSTESFFPEVSLVFAVRDAAQNYHVPLLLSPYGYTTYRGH